MRFFYALCLLALFVVEGRANFGPPPFRRGPPAFLRDVTDAQRRQYFEIVTSPNATKAQIRQNAAAWAANAGVTTQYNNYTTTEQQRAQQFHDAVAGNLTGAAAQLFDKFWTITQDDTITRLAECQQMRAAMDGADALLRRLTPLPPPSIAGPPPQGCFPAFPGAGGKMGPPPMGMGPPGPMSSRMGPLGGPGPRMMSESDDNESEE